MSDNVEKFPIKFKSPADKDRFLVRVKNYDCRHRRFEVDEALAEVTCADCKAKLNPMHVLYVLATEETLWHHARERYAEEMKRLDTKRRTKCEHCKSMTRIK